MKFLIFASITNSINNIKKLIIMKEIVDQMNAIMDAIKADLGKDTKAAAARVRKATLEFEKVGKAYRKASIAAEKM